MSSSFEQSEYNKQLDVPITLLSDYGLKSLEILIDHKQISHPALASVYNQEQCSLTLSFPTDDLENGEHLITIKSNDKSYHANQSMLIKKFIINKTMLSLSQLAREYTIKQGRTLHLTFLSNKPLTQSCVKFLGAEYSCYPQNKETLIYESFVPIDCEQMPGTHNLEIFAQDKSNTNLTLKIPVTIEKVVFPRQKGFSVKEEKIAQEKEMSMNDTILEKALTQWLQDSPKEKLWQGPFEKPIEVKSISTPFGEIRTTPARGRYFHKGVDLVNTPRSIVWASNHGKIIIKDRFVLTGNTVVIDHGRGIFTLYYHLEDFADIQVGSFVKKGNPLGKLGMTGYASGYHLHWELRINNIAVDPFEWTETIY